MIDNRKIRDETDALLRRIESRIPPKAPTVSRLSGGQRQAVAMARAHVIQLARRLAARASASSTLATT